MFHSYLDVWLQACRALDEGPVAHGKVDTYPRSSGQDGRGVLVLLSSINSVMMSHCTGARIREEGTMDSEKAGLLAGGL